MDEDRNVMALDEEVTTVTCKVCGTVNEFGELDNIDICKVCGCDLIEMYG